MKKRSFSNGNAPPSSSRSKSDVYTDEELTPTHWLLI